jgi:cyanophycinase
LKRFVWVAASLLVAQPAMAQDIGPASGSLVVVGGAMRDPEIIKRFIQLAGGPDAPLVLIPTAGGGDSYDQYWSGQRLFREQGATNITVLHTYDRAEADTDEFAQVIREARGVWFGGGRQWRLADSYLNTKSHEAFWDVLSRGGVIGGSSAGASIQGSLLIRGDTRSNTVMLGDHLEGLGFLKNVGVDQHLLRRNRQFDMLEVMDAYPDLLGIGLDENTAIVVQGDQLQVIGQSYAVIFDNTAQIDTGGRFYFLGAGDRYNMKTRRASRMANRSTPLERVVRKPGN